MEWLNYHHLLYFWTTARTGSIANASRELLLAPPTISAQIRHLEEALGEKLFERTGRRLVLTEPGRIVLRYAEEIFGLGREMLDTLKDRPTGLPLRVQIGVADVLPKMMAFKLVQPALHALGPVHLICKEGTAERLLVELATNELDAVLADAPIREGTKVRAFNHLLGECGVAFFGSRELASKLRGRFPRSLDHAPMLLPTSPTAIRPRIEQWLESNGIRPRIAGEFDDFALMRTFGEVGLGVLPAPIVLDREMSQRHKLVRIGRAGDVRAQFFAISVERKIQNPAVIAICEKARRGVFQNR